MIRASLTAKDINLMDTAVCLATLSLALLGAVIAATYSSAWLMGSSVALAAVGLYFLVTVVLRKRRRRE